jgi:alpha 1,3-glucosidase
MVERIVIMGVKKSPKTIAGGEGGTIDFEYDSTSKVLVLRKPLVSALEPWQITIG